MFFVLAHILVRTVEEFQGMEIEKVASLIEGDPYISKVPVASGLTNKDRNVEGKRIVGLNTEAGEKNEGLVRFDIIFYVRMRNGLAQMIINVEAQKDEPGSYQIVKRQIVSGENGALFSTISPLNGILFSVTAQSWRNKRHAIRRLIP